MAHDGELRVGIFTDDFYPYSGGVARSIEQQINHLVELGHHVTLFAPRTDFDPPQACAWESLPNWYIPGTPSYLSSLVVSSGTARRIAASHQLDVVHSQNERGSIYLTALVARAAGLPHVHTFHSNYAGTHLTSPGQAALNSLTYLPAAGRLLRSFARRDSTSPLRTPTTPRAAEDSVHARRDWKSLARLARELDAFTSPASFMKECMVDAAPELADVAHVVPSGIDQAFLDVTRTRGSGGPIRFLSCSRLGAEKRVDAIISAYEQIASDDNELVIIGTGPQEAALKRQAAQVRRGTVRMLGRMENTAQVAQHMADADVFVLASYHFDTQGIVLAEAAATGTPIVYCDERLTVGVGPENAVLCGRSASDLAAAMASLAADPQRRAAMSAAGRALGPSLTGKAMAQSYVDVYRQALAVAPRLRSGR